MSVKTEANSKPNNTLIKGINYSSLEKNSQKDTATKLGMHSFIFSLLSYLC